VNLPHQSLLGLDTGRSIDVVEINAVLASILTAIMDLRVSYILFDELSGHLDLKQK
jgi:hypothetical protein